MAAQAEHPLRAARKAAGLSPEGLAFKAGVSIKTVERIERGQAEPRRATAREFARVLECAPSDLGWPDADMETAA